MWVFESAREVLGARACEAVGVVVSDDDHGEVSAPQGMTGASQSSELFQRALLYLLSFFFPSRLSSRTHTF